MTSTVHSTGRASPFVLTYVAGILPQSEKLELKICAIHLHSSLAAMSGVFSRGTDKEIHKSAPVPADWWKSKAAAPKIVTLSTSKLNFQATKRPQPDYPTEAKAASAQGPVQVQITVSESGKVIEAKTIVGHEMLRDAAEQAAMQWEFIPVKISGAPVKMRGILVFVFAL